MKKIPMMIPRGGFGNYMYPWANDIRILQQSIFWTAEEINVSKDIQDYKQMTSEQFALVSFTLQLFVEIEQHVGKVWFKIAELFPHPEIEGACVQIAAMEQSVHAFFYQKMNDELNISTEEIIKNQQEVKQLKDKLAFLESTTKGTTDPAMLLVTVSFIEQVFLFSNFAMLMSFKANGHNMIPQTLTGVEFVKSDEQTHGDLATALFNQYCMEQKEVNNIDVKADIKADVLDLVSELVAHETAVISHLYKDIDKINDVSSYHLEQFVYHRANFVLAQLGYEPLYTIEDKFVEGWFYDHANAIKLHDFFNAGTAQYSRKWSEQAFTRLQFINKDK